VEFRRICRMAWATGFARNPGTCVPDWRAGRVFRSLPKGSGCPSGSFANDADARLGADAFARANLSGIHHPAGISVPALALECGSLLAAVHGQYVGPTQREKAGGGRKRQQAAALQRQKRGEIAGNSQGISYRQHRTRQGKDYGGPRDCATLRRAGTEGIDGTIYKGLLALRGARGGPHAR